MKKKVSIIISCHKEVIWDSQSIFFLFAYPSSFWSYSSPWSYSTPSPGLNGCFFYVLIIELFKNEAVMTHNNVSLLLISLSLSLHLFLHV